MERFLILFAVLVNACATVPTDPAASTPTCEAGRECRVKWRAAERWITNVARRPLHTKSDDEMSTRMDASPGNNLSVRVKRIRVDSGEYRIEAEIFCARVGCDPSPWQALQDFNRSVNRSWKPMGEDSR